MVTFKGGAIEPADTLLPGKAGGAAAVRRTLASTICRAICSTQVPRPRQLRDASTVMRFRPAHQSMINRRHDGRASRPARHSPKHALQRKPQIHLPATWKGGHESGTLLTLGTRSPPPSYPRKRVPRGNATAPGRPLFKPGAGSGPPPARGRRKRSPPFGYYH